MLHFHPRLRAIVFVLFLLTVMWRSDIIPMLNDWSVDVSKECVTLETDVNDFIAQANYCKVDSDCLAIPLNCPFGCQDGQTLIHTSQEHPVKVKVANYNERCGFCIEECPTLTAAPRCVEQRCVSSY